MKQLINAFGQKPPFASQNFLENDLFNTELLRPNKIVSIKKIETRDDLNTADGQIYALVLQCSSEALSLVWVSSASKLETLTINKNDALAGRYWIYCYAPEWC